MLAALGLSRQEAAASIRFGLGRGTEERDGAAAAGAVREAVLQLRNSV